MKRLEKFFFNIQQDIKVYLFFLLLICLYRAYFIWYMSSCMAPGTGTGEICSALWAGFRLSLKSAGVCTVPGFVFLTVIAGLICPRWDLGRLRLVLGGIASLLLAVLFQARFPYYREFQSTFGMQIAYGMKDDVQAIFVTMVQEYQLPARLAAAIVLALISYGLLKRLLAVRTLPLPFFSSNGRKYAFTASMAVVISAVLPFLRFGGSFNYEHSINWENAGVTSDVFLNECILDDIQGLYRAWSYRQDMKTGRIDGVQPENIQASLELLHGGIPAGTDGTLLPYLQHQAQGAKLAKPRHIFIILGETWAQWPLMDKYAGLHIADGIKSLAASSNAYYTDTFMPNGDFTSIAIEGMITGLSEVSVAPNCRPGSYKAIYPTAMAPQFQSLGYQVDFWYGGMPSWENLQKFSLAQGFDHFYGCPDYGAPKQSIWGTTDGNLFAALEKHLGTEDQPTVHLIMTTSNHPPYNIDLAAEGFDLAAEEKAIRELIPAAQDPKQMALELGHYWYMDKIVTDFVHQVMQEYPDSLFIITGDHSVRMDPGGHPSLYEHQSIPLVLYGQGVTKDILPPEVTGGHTSIVPTLLELIAPRGFTYASIAHSLTEGNQPAFNRDVWMTPRAVGMVSADRAEDLPGKPGADLAAEKAAVRPWITAMRTVSWWLLMKGNTWENN